MTATSASNASTFDSTLANLGIKRTSTSATAASSGSTTLGQADFLKLMTAQMQNQDPFNPVDNTQMVAQMAQFSSLAGISEMSSTLKGISEKLGATSVSDASSYIGKTVLTAGDTAYGRSGGGIAGAIELSGAASNVKVTIEGANGEVLNQLALGAQPKGTVEYDWDGKTVTGADAGTGPFKITVTAQNNTGQDKGATVAATGLVWAPVQSVSVPASGSPTLNVAGIGSVATTAVRQIG